MKGIVNTEWDIWDADKIDNTEEKIFNAVYALNENSFVENGFNEKCSKVIHSINDHLLCKVGGCYFPPKGRSFLTNTIDSRSDKNSDVITITGPSGYFPCDDEGADLSGWVFYPVKNIPRKVLMRDDGKKYRAINWRFWEKGVPRKNYDNIVVREENKDLHMEYFSTYLCVNGDDVSMAIDRRKISPLRANIDVWRKMFCIAYSAYADRKHLWNVVVPYNITSKVKCWVSLGVQEEHIKSLFYSRKAPVTSSGRKRPILHWVQSHSRRISDGVDVDIKKHLRGITDFRMFDFDMKIISPIKDHNKSYSEYEGRCYPFVEVRG